jgi:hypothetical protein
MKIYISTLIGVIALLTYSVIQAQNFNCTQVIGFSQVGAANGGWYVEGTGVTSNFELAVGDTLWQLLWNSGASVDKWMNPDYVGWNNTIISTCSTNSTLPDRILFAISGPQGTDVDAWSDDIDSAIVTIRTKYSSVNQIILQPVVGGPLHQTCFIGADSVRASWQHKYIDSAIAIVAANDPDVIVGCSPEVLTCGDYKDVLGHLFSSAAQSLGSIIGNCYSSSTTGLNEVHANNFINIYPNPTYGSVFIEGIENENVKCKLINLIGKHYDIDCINGFVDLSTYADGIYLLILDFGEYQITKKIINKNQF